MSDKPLEPLDGYENMQSKTRKRQIYLFTGIGLTVLAAIDRKSTRLNSSHH